MKFPNSKFDVGETVRLTDDRIAYIYRVELGMDSTGLVMERYDVKYGKDSRETNVPVTRIEGIVSVMDIK